MSKRGARGGFTLLEVVLAMTAMALVAAITYGVFHLGIRAVERGEIAVVTAQRLRATSDVFIRQVKSAVAYPARNEDDEVYPYFFGSPTTMTFVTAAGLVGGGSLARVSYRIESDPPRLVLAESPFFSPDTLGRDSFDPVGEREAVLLDGFGRAEFRYLLFDGADYEWRRAWDAREEELLPVAVGVTIEGLPGSDAGTWGQEVPLMAATYSETSGEVDEDDIAERLHGLELMGRGGGGSAAGDENAGGDDVEPDGEDGEEDDEP
jgi:prepilin-type N-terminal cleavage/methylation domain-containing protein